MDKKIVTFGDIETEKRKFNYSKNPIFLKDESTDNVLLSNKFFSGEKTINT